MVGRALILTIFGMFVVSTMFLRTIVRSTNTQNDNVVRYYQRSLGRDISQGGANLALRQLASNSLWRTGYSSLYLSGGRVSVTLSDVNFQRDAKSNVVAATKITSVCYLPFTTAVSQVTIQDTTFTTVAFVARGFKPGGVRGTVTTQNHINTGGNVLIDGRDHDTTGALLPGQGTFGIWTTDTLTQGGSSDIGGTNLSGTDFAPVGKTPGPDTSIIRINQGGIYYGSPDSVMGTIVGGYPEGTLKSIAQSGVSGSQYVTDPTKLSYPLRGVTYVDLPAGASPSVWSPCNINGSGILVVHNSTKNAFMKDIQPSTFFGLLIADDISHINSTFTIYGAIVGLTANASTTNDLGNGNSRIYFSSIAIENATGYAKTSSVTTYNNKVLAWWE